MKTDDPICGRCGNRLSEHECDEDGECYCEQGYVFSNLFSSEPSSGEIIHRLCFQFPDIYDRIVSEWRQENGHE